MKRIFAYVLILIIAFFLYFISKILPDFYFNLGKKAYEQKDYFQAYKYLKTSVHLKPKSMQPRYYFVETMLNLKPMLEIQRELYEISQANQSDSADLIADMQISKWHNQIMTNAGENYIEQAPSNGRILRWDSTKFPLKIYLQNDSSTAPDYYLAEIKKAFLKWQQATGNFIKFVFTDNEKEANIDIIIKSSDEMKKCTQEDCKYTIAYTVPIVSGDFLRRMTISFYDSNNLGKPFSQNNIYATALHEIGHSLGIMGHSYDEDDIMYMESGNNTGFFKKGFQSISSRDINTVRLLYELVPDITNTPLSNFNTNNQFFAPIVIGTEEQAASRKILEAQNYIDAAPDVPNGYIDLAAAFMDQKQYKNAVEALNKALLLCSNDNERFIIYYNFTVIYMGIKDWQDALKYANMALHINASDDTLGMIAMINYNLGNKDVAKKTYMEALEKNPANIIDAYNLATIYIKELNLIQAGKVLNQLIKTNPDAKNNPMVKKYSILIFLFK